MAAVSVKKRRPMGKQEKNEALWGIAFVAPGILGVLVFTAFPLLFSIFMSFTTWDVMSVPKLNGLANYVELLRDPVVGREFLNTLYFAGGSVPICIFVSMVLAYLLSTKIRGRTVYRTIFFLPYVSMPAAITMVWQWLLNSQYGLVNQLFMALGLPKMNWMTDPHLIMPSIIIISIWSSIGYNMVILLAGLQNIPTTYYEAASIDGATSVRQFFHITVPLISPTTFFLLIISFIGSFKAFDIVYIIIGAAASTGGPLNEATRTVVYGIYERGLYFFRMGYASAEAVALFLIILAITGIQFLAQKKWVYYE